MNADSWLCLLEVKWLKENEIVNVYGSKDTENFYLFFFIFISS